MKLVAAAAIICCLVELGSAADFVKCDRSYHKVGCYKESQTTMDLLISDRDKSSSVYEGHMLQWTKFKESIHSLACRCSSKAKAMGYSYFSIRFWAECYGGMDHTELDVLVKRPDAVSNQCANHQFQSCDVNVAEECVGKAATEYIYSLNSRAEESKDGNYTAWSEWTDCSNECGPGTQERERSCTNPEPLGSGAGCEPLGPSTESRSCQVKECPVWRKVLGKTSYGVWGPEYRCKKGEFINAFRLRVEKKQGAGVDDTGLNSIKVQCTDGIEGTSKEGFWGDWKPKHTCPSGVVTSFNFMSEANQKGDDDAAGNNVNLKCEDGKTMKGEGVSWASSSWDCPNNKMCSCPSGMALCGIKTKVEPKQGSGSDDTSLNQIEFICCNKNTVKE